MSATFSFIEGDLSTPLQFARFRLDDTDAEIREDSVGNPAPYLWDEEYEALFAAFGVKEGMAQAAGKIAAVIAKDITRFGESGGISVAFDNLQYYRNLPNIIRSEPNPFGEDNGTLAVTGSLRAGTTSSLAFQEPTLYPRFKRVFP